MKNIPTAIYLNTKVSKLNFNDTDFAELQNITWSTEDKGDGSIPYVLMNFLSDAEETIKLLCQMIMEQHDFRDEVLRLMRDKNYEEAHYTVKMKFPMLQGTAVHSLFREVGKMADKNFVGLTAIRRIYDKETK